MTYNKGEKMSSLKALKELKENAQEVCEWELDRLNIIEKDLEILEILKNSMSVETVTFKNDNEVEKYEYEYIAFNDWNLDIENKEDYNKIRKWLIEK